MFVMLEVMRELFAIFRLRTNLSVTLFVTLEITNAVFVTTNIRNTLSVTLKVTNTITNRIVHYFQVTDNKAANFNIP